MSYQRLAEAVLVDWREVEFQILQRPGPSSESASLEAEAVGLRREYELLIDAARRDGRPEPPPFPVDPDGDEAYDTDSQLELTA